ncbi:Zinc finger and BTB domain-containing protein 22 [Porphyridium purpureum]|uniref:Zinc finger and BTB domain-containing protein 22 n=1 Tax=Porphyridium purpureum TaxID=35688 RepID=A0A5J4Z4B2_PORPP|nr:Zinc finger and BTB domain-containing protein 22 [Porphyridium purpureum]|eukprot:POR1782..scf295_1
MGTNLVPQIIDFRRWVGAKVWEWYLTIPETDILRYAVVRERLDSALVLVAGAPNRCIHCGDEILDDDEVCDCQLDSQRQHADMTCAHSRTDTSHSSSGGVTDQRSQNTARGSRASSFRSAVQLECLEQWVTVRQLNRAKRKQSTKPSVRLERVYLLDKAIDGWIVGFVCTAPARVIASMNSSNKELRSVDQTSKPTMSTFFFCFTTGVLLEVHEMQGKMLINKLHLMGSMGLVAKSLVVDAAEFKESGRARLYTEVIMKTVKPCDFCLMRGLLLCECPFEMRARHCPELNMNCFDAFRHFFSTTFASHFSLHTRTVAVPESDNILPMTTRVVHGDGQRLRAIKEMLVQARSDEEARLSLSYSRLAPLPPQKSEPDRARSRLDWRTNAADTETPLLMCQTLASMAKASDYEDEPVERRKRRRLAVLCSGTGDSKGASFAPDGSSGSTWSSHAKRLNDQGYDSKPRENVRSPRQTMGGQVSGELADEGAERMDLECSICNATFRLRGNLNRHLRTAHMGIRNYNCDICCKKFTARDKLSRHENTQTHKDKMKEMGLMS